jgi:hypothetical protein
MYEGNSRRRKEANQALRMNFVLPQFFDTVLQCAGRGQRHAFPRTARTLCMKEAE